MDESGQCQLPRWGGGGLTIVPPSRVAIEHLKKNLNKYYVVISEI